MPAEVLPLTAVRRLRCIRGTAKSSHGQFSTQQYARKWRG